MDPRTPVLYLAPWVDVGGADKGTIDWFRFLDRERFRASLITTQPSPNRRLAEIAPYAEELWELPQLMPGDEFPRFILSFIQSRGIRVVHIMNSRLAFELLPDIAVLADRPRVVVQLHVEESDCSGYVRYVTTRFGNLVDAFSVSTRALSDRLDVYDVPVAKRRLIPTGVDGEREFSPARVTPIEGLDRDRFQILFAARVTAQKDPLLMLEVATRARDAALDFQLHVLGDGDLAGAVREQVAARGLEGHVLMQGDTLEVARWYAACDAVLLTSQFEGLPYVAYEAMAMALPVVAPSLPGMDELVTPGTGVLISRRNDARAYAEALATLAGDPARRRRMGELARAHVREHHSLERMAAEHAALYDELLALGTRPRPSPRTPTNGRPPAPRPAAGFRGRRPGARPLVSVIVPCLNHGRYLPACLRSVARQTYGPIETIVIDDGSTDPDTLDVLRRLEEEGSGAVVRLPENRGPAAARNAGIERARGRYVLPLDADNLLLPSAIADLVEQLSNAGELVGFVYPNVQYFGNRSDYFEAPSYDLHALLGDNYCDTASLFDREVFDRGLRYPEDIVIGHEDWDFALSLGEAGIYGEAARSKTLLYRKSGFNRSDIVGSCLRFDAALAARHPGLFAAKAELKGRWNPALTVIALDPVPALPDATLPGLVAAAAAQTCPDFELIVRSSREPAPTELGGRLRRIPTELSGSSGQALSDAVAVARGRFALATYGSPAALLADPALVEKVLRVIDSADEPLALALADSAAGGAALRLLSDEEAATASLAALCWPAIGPAAPPPSLLLPNGQPLEELARLLVAHAPVQWRHLPRGDSASLTTGASSERTRLGQPRCRARDAKFSSAAPALPECPPGYTGSLDPHFPWRPPQARLLCRHRHRGSGRYLYTNSESPPPEHALDRVLGILRSMPVPGTAPLVSDGSGGPPTIGQFGSISHDDPALLGFVEQVPLQLLDELWLARHRQTGQEVLVGGPADPLAAAVEAPRTIGHVEAYPIHPRGLSHRPAGVGLVGLVRTVDRAARRHRYAAGRMPAGVPAGELGALFAAPVPDTEPLCVDEQGDVFVPERALSNGRPSLGGALEWTTAPLTWSEISGWGPKLRATARRAYDSARLLASGRANGAALGEPAGYLLRSATARSVPLYAAVHPVTGDQLLSNTSEEPTSLGYGHVVLLGHLIAQAPVTGRLGGIRVAAPWASRFGVPVGAVGA